KRAMTSRPRESCRSQPWFWSLRARRQFDKKMIAEQRFHSSNHRASMFFKHVFVLRVSDGQRALGSRANHELKAQLSRCGGEEGNCAIGIFATGDFAFPLAKIKDRGSARGADGDLAKRRICVVFGEL